MHQASNLGVGSSNLSGRATSYVDFPNEKFFVNRYLQIKARLVAIMLQDLTDIALVRRLACTRAPVQVYIEGINIKAV